MSEEEVITDAALEKLAIKEKREEWRQELQTLANEYENASGNVWSLKTMIVKIVFVNEDGDEFTELPSEAMLRAMLRQAEIEEDQAYSELKKVALAGRRQHYAE